uniref:WD_REPEATS_REGION domain-containing protein n=1 Tax=Strongyloides papillosus TaxID=174720 RepID=A0A0N5BRM1_STREA
MNPSNITYKNNSINQQNRERLLRNSLGESFENQVQKLKLTELHIHNILMNILHDEPVDSFDFSHISTRRITRAFERELEEKRKQEEKRDSRDRSLNNTIFDIEFSEDEELDTEYNPLQNVSNIENPNLVLQNYHSRDWNNDINYPNTRSRHNESAYYMSDEYRCFDTSFAVYDDDPIYKDFLTNLDNNDQCDYSQDEEDDPEFDPSQEPNFFENFDDDDESVKISKSELKQFVEDLDTPNIITDVIVVSPNCETSEDSSSSASRQILSSTPKDYESEHNSGKQGRRFVQPSPEEYKFYDFSNSASCIHGRGLMTKDEQDQFITQTEMLVQLLLQFIVCYHFDQIDDKYGKMYKDMLNNLLCQQACSSSNSLLRKVRNIYSAVNHYQTLTNLRVDEFNHQLMFPDTLHHTSFKPVHVYSGIVLATSDALMYPKLLPFQKFYISSVQGSVFSRSEINLMKFALARTKESQKQFKNTKSPKYVSIIEKYFPLRTTEQLRWRISSARNSKNKEINSVQFALQNKISYFEDYTKKHSEFNGIIRASFDVGQVLCPLHWLEKWMPEWLRVLKTKIMQGEYSKTFPNLTIPRNTLSEVTKPQNVPTSSVVPVGPKVIIPQGINITQPIQIIQLNEIPQVVKVPVINECSYQNSVDQVKINNNQGNEELKNNSGDRIIDPLEIEKYIAEMQNLKNQKKRNRRNNAYGARNVTDDDFANEPFREYQTSLVPSSQVSTDPTLKNYSRHDLHKIRFHLGMKKQEAIQSGTWDISKDVYDPDEVSEACVKVDEDKKRKETENAERRKRRYNLSKKISNDDNGEGRERKE